ncbi:type IV pilus biogenesis/stability protein PilW [Salinimonas marina]|uniref:Type IV pilus biogenesis/stability protein PilW n=1 Tax=Salinimonas marina TaxID=2785918 RepID=A0A7S9DZE3_9ALTE|nr:type IV pilus biogenesis/stability protein PilW [Salinimonas marina]QPG06468.1 type IV pilus biogenesis/stability protein PilW [Salinimonas marina]
MRKSLIACVFVLTGCVSQSQPGMLSDNFDQSEAARTRMSLGLTYLKNGDYTQAKKNLDRALEFAPRLADVHYAMAYYYQTVEEVPRAVEYYENALDLAPRNADIANSYGAFLCQQRQFDKAQELFLKAVNNKRYANTAQTYENMGLCARDQGLHPQAIEYFKTALNHQPSRGKTLMLLTQEYLETGRYEEAKDSLRRYQKMARVTAQSLWLAVQVADAQDDIESVRSYGEMLRSLYPESIQYQRYTELEKQLSTVTNARNNHTNIKNSQGAPRPGNSEATLSASARALASDLNSLPVAEKEQVHIVQFHENLYRISVKYNIRMSSLRSWNNLAQTDVLEVGSRLWLVPPEQQTNQVVE